MTDDHKAPTLTAEDVRRWRLEGDLQAERLTRLRLERKLAFERQRQALLALQSLVGAAR
jgi:hypothetical protein